MTCAWAGCELDVRIRGFCETHYKTNHARERRHTDPEYAERVRELNRRQYHREAKARSVLRQLKVYGLTREEYDAMVARHAGRCGICDREAKLHIDHCHETGRVRGFLCSPCNRALGTFNDDPALLMKALEWLRGTCHAEA